MSQILRLSVIEMALAELTEGLLSLQDLEHVSEVPDVVFLHLAIYKNVIQIYQYALPYLMGEDLVHERLEDSRSIQ